MGQGALAAQAVMAERVAMAHHQALVVLADKLEQEPLVWLEVLFMQADLLVTMLAIFKMIILKALLV